MATPRKPKASDIDDAQAANIREQEKFIMRRLNLHGSLEKRAVAFQTIAELDLALCNEPVLLFAHSDKDEPVEPSALQSFIEELIFDCALIHEMAINCNPTLTADKVDSFLSDAFKLTNVGDYEIKCTYMMMLKRIIRVNKSCNTAELADLFLVDVPAVLNELLDQVTGKHVKRKDIFRQRLAKNPKIY